MKIIPSPNKAEKKDRIKKKINRKSTEILLNKFHQNKYSLMKLGTDHIGQVKELVLNALFIKALFKLFLRNVVWDIWTFYATFG